jgi:hypothetical protein
VTAAASALATASPVPVAGYLPYSTAQTAPQDISHQLWTATSIDYLRDNRDAPTLMVRGPLWRAQARRFRDYGVASALGGHSLFDSSGRACGVGVPHRGAASYAGAPTRLP